MRAHSMLVGLLLISLPTVGEAQKKSHKPRNRVRCGTGTIPANHVCHKITPSEPGAGPRKPLPYAPRKSADAKAPAGATAKCRDGTWSVIKSRTAACSKHGGVGKWMAARGGLHTSVPRKT